MPDPDATDAAGLTLTDALGGPAFWIFALASSLFGLVYSGIALFNASDGVAGNELWITDGTAAAGLPVGARARLGDQTIIAGERTAVLEDGTLAGSLLTMDGALRMLLGLGLTLPEAVRMCASTPAEALGLSMMGAIAAGNHADLVVLTSTLTVQQTFIAGRPVLERG